MKNDDLVMVGVLGAGLVTAVGQIGTTGSLPSSRIGFGVFIALVLLLLLSEAAPDLAAGFAVLMFLTALFVEGAPLWKTLTRDTAGPTTTPGHLPAGATATNHPNGPYLPGA